MCVRVLVTAVTESRHVHVCGVCPTAFYSATWGVLLVHTGQRTTLVILLLFQLN